MTTLKILNNKDHKIINTFELNDLDSLIALTNILLQRENGHKKDNKITYTYNKQGKKIIKATMQTYINSAKNNIYVYKFDGDFIEQLRF